jgi:TetR/AcrR family transcriptional regulator
MGQPRRLGADGAKNRERLIDAAEELLGTEGYASITAKQVTAKAGLKAELLYYYFQTLDDLILAVVQRISKGRLERFEQALAAPEPLRMLWDLMSSQAIAAVSTELISLAGHREAVRAEIVRSAEEFRALQVRAVDELLAQRGVNRERYPAAGIVLIGAALARAIKTEAALGLLAGHAEALMILEQLLADFGAPAPAQRPSTRGKAAKVPARRRAR